MNQHDYQRRYDHRRKTGGRCLECGCDKGKGSTMTRCESCAKAHRRRSNERYYQSKEVMS